VCRKFQIAFYKKRLEEKNIREPAKMQDSCNIEATDASVLGTKEKMLFIGR